MRDNFIKTNIYNSIIILKLAVILFLFSLNANAIPAISPDSTRIYGHAPEYTNNNLVFLKYSDRITFLRDTLFVLEIDEDGYFDITVKMDDVTYAFTEYEVYHAYLFTEPGEEYEIVLPPLEFKTEADIFNPFYTPERIHIGIKDMKPTDLNYLILEFDYFFDRYFEFRYREIASLGMQSSVDTFINEIRKHFSFADNKYFNSYTKFRYAKLRHFATQKNYPHVVVYANYTNDTVWYDNPAYMDLFNIIYNDYFDEYLTTQGGRHLYNFIHFGHSISNIRDLFSRHMELNNDQFKELVILKGLNDAFNNNNFAWLPLLLTLDSLHISTPYPIHQDIAQNIADNTLSMTKGTVAPPFSLESINGDTLSLNSFRGHFVYLVFANTSSFSSKMELGLLKRIYDRYRHVCKIVTILTDDDRQAAKDFIKRNNFEWDFLFASLDSPIVRSYGIRAYPTYFLLDQRGVLLMSPAPGPGENFERYLFEMLKYRDMLDLF